MDYKEAEIYFDSEETLGEVLDNCKESLGLIDSIGAEMRAGQITDPKKCEEVLQKLNGCFAFINPIFKVAEVQKKNRQERNYVSLKIEAEKEGAKFVSASADRESSANVANYRRVRSILEGYVEICKTLIGSTQSLLKSLQEEKASS